TSFAAPQGGAADFGAARQSAGMRELSVADVLDLTVAEGVQLFRDDREVVRLLQPIVAVGLEYVKLGQPVPTLSGGEAQRLKLAGFLAEAAQNSSASRQALARRGTLFMFDEPTTGLHFDDIAKLMRSFRRLLEAGHSIVVIEHNLDVIRASDWLIDLGPEGGDAGGEVVATGTPEDVKRHASSHTAKALREYDRALGFGGPAVDAVYGIPPTVAIEQRLSRGGRKSTVATTTEVWHFLRLLYVKLGLQHCVVDGSPVAPQSAESIAAQLLRDHAGEHIGLLAPLV